jgi:hypothetical protein
MDAAIPEASCVALGCSRSVICQDEQYAKMNGPSVCVTRKIQNIGLTQAR